MALERYKEKRDFEKTPEPTGGKAGRKGLRFVVQKHYASHLHYDFRLEMEGVLKSWAVPKGPSMDPEIKRLAMMVEDHPYDYRRFEGIIPSGYGAGTVIVWDEGTYEPMDFDGKTKSANDKHLLSELKKGKVKIVLHGQKLQGTFALVKAYGRGENGWLLMKLEDEHATKKDILKKEESVLSGKTLEQLEKKAVKPKETEKAKTSPKSAARRDPGQVKSKTGLNKLSPILRKLPSKNFPAKFSPMLTTLASQPIDDPSWVYEVKWDGYRAVGFRNGDKTELRSRNDKSFNEQFYPVYQALQEWNIRAVVDGEIVVMDERGISGFNSLQNWRSEADGDLQYYLFDITWLEGKDLTGLPLTERKRLLESVMPQSPVIRLSEAFEIAGTEFFETASKMGLEGIVGKLKDSLYFPGARTDEWLKIKTSNRQEMVIGGYTKNEGSSKPFSALLVGVYEKGKLVYTGKVGTGFSHAAQKEMLKAFKPLIRKTTPFAAEPDVNKPSRFRPDPPHAEVTWLKPQLVCEVEFTEMTSEGVMRHPSFEGMRTDKKAADVVRERPI